MGFARRLGVLAEEEADGFVASYCTLIRGLQTLIASLDEGV